MTRSLKHHSVHGAVATDDESAPPAEGADLMPKKGEVLINPRYHFHRPRAVLRAEVLDRQEKIDVLQDWERDLREEKQPGTRTFRADPSAVGSELGEVRSALKRLESGKLDTA